MSKTRAWLRKRRDWVLRTKPLLGPTHHVRLRRTNESEALARFDVEHVDSADPNRLLCRRSDLSPAHAARHALTWRPLTNSGVINELAAIGVGAMMIRLMTVAPGKPRSGQAKEQALQKRVEQLQQLDFSRLMESSGLAEPQRQFAALRLPDVEFDEAPVARDVGDRPEMTQLFAAAVRHAYEQHQRAIDSSSLTNSPMPLLQLVDASIPPCRGFTPTDTPHQLNQLILGSFNADIAYRWMTFGQTQMDLCAGLPSPAACMKLQSSMHHHLNALPPQQDYHVVVDLAQAKIEAMLRLSASRRA